MAGDVRIETVGFDEIAERFSRGALKIHRILPREMRKATLMVSRDAKILAPVDTGLLRSSILPEIEVVGFDVTGIVGSEVEYAWFQEDGTKNKDGTQRIPPKRYLERGAMRNLDKIAALLGNVIIGVIGGRKT